MVDNHEDRVAYCASCGRGEGDDSPRVNIFREDVQQVANLLQKRYGKVDFVIHDDEGGSSQLVELDACIDCGYVVCQECARNPLIGACHCAASDFGVAYADMADGPKPHMGANGGTRYVGPFKCRAQRDMEAQLMQRHEPGHKPFLGSCGYGDCGQPLDTEQAKLCSCCRSEVYCSVECQRLDWMSSHRASCGKYLPPQAWPYVSRGLAAYREHWGRFPTAKLTPEQHASDAALQASLHEEAATTDACRRAYLTSRDQMLERAGLGDLIAEMAVPMDM